MKHPNRLTSSDFVALGAVSLWLVGAALGAVYGLWLALGSTAILVGALVLALQHRSLVTCFRFRIIDLVVGVCGGFVMVLASRALFTPVSNAYPFVKVDAATLYAALEGKSSILYAMLIVPIALGEEIVWRGAVQGAVMRRFSGIASVPIMAVLYALVHMPVGVPSLGLIAFACGLGWGLLRSFTAGLWAPFVAHLLWDEIMFFVAPLSPG